MSDFWVDGADQRSTIMKDLLLVCAGKKNEWCSHRHTSYGERDCQVNLVRFFTSL